MGSASGHSAAASALAGSALDWDELAETSGLQAVGASGPTCSGAGVPVAVLDTGFELAHPDFVGRSVTSQSFVDGQEVQDGHGHGTHCISTACGSLRPEILPRYGVAHGCEIYAGKVLSNQGGGADRGILAGINWAVSNQCRLVIFVAGSGNLIEDNQADRNYASGVAISGNGNTIEDNTATGNAIAPLIGGRTTFDLKDFRPDCGTNVWRANSFITADPACTTR